MISFNGIKQDEAVRLGEVASLEIFHGKVVALQHANPMVLEWSSKLF